MASTTAAAPTSGPAQSIQNDTKAPDFEPPQACISRILKSALPDNISITKDARAAFARAAGIFIFYITHCANDFSRENKRQTIYPHDILNALKELEFEEFAPQLEDFLEHYRREARKSRADKKDDKANEQDEGKAADDNEDGNDDVNDMDE